MSLSFQDWSGIVPKAIIQSKCGPESMPDSGPYLIKIFAPSESDWPSLVSFAHDHSLPINVPRRVRDKEIGVGQYDPHKHIDLYGLQLDLASGQSIMNSDEVRQFWFPNEGKVRRV